MSGTHAWTHLFIDLDDTLLDFKQSERAALLGTLHEMGFSGTAPEVQAYHAANDALWKQVEQGTMTQSVLRWLRFEHFLTQMGQDATMAQKMSDVYVRHFALQGHVLDGAMAFLAAMRPRMTICALTNGISSIQRGRIDSSGIAPFLDHVVISDEEGVSKPDPAIFHIAMARSGCSNVGHAVMLGDSLTSDIAGANAAGIASVYLCPDGKKHPAPTFQVRSLQESAALLSKYAAAVK